MQSKIATLEAEIAPVLTQDATWATAAERLQSIPGIGLLTASWLIVLTLNFSLCPSADAAAAYAGLAPNDYRSGTSVQKRACIGHTGNSRLHTAVDWVRTQCGILLQPVLRSDARKGFVVLPRRWVVERTVAWLTQCRRLCREYEVLPVKLEVETLKAVGRQSPLCPPR